MISGEIIFACGSYSIALKILLRGCLKIAGTLYFPQGSSSYKAKAQEYLLYSEDLGRSKRQFLLGKAAF